jgi:hypothetical protein
MSDTRRLKIIIDQEGNAGAGVKGITKGFGGLATAIPVAGAAALAVTAVGGAAVGVGSKLIALGSDAEEMQGKFDVVFGDFGPGVIKDLDEFGNVVGRDTFELQGMASSIQDLLVPMGMSREAAAGMSTDVTKLAVDLGSFNNVSDELVAKDIASALTGETEGMKKYGVILNQATINQELMNMGIEGGTKAATQAEKAQAILNLIYKGTTDAQGDATRTAGSWANQMRALKATVSETATSIGLELLPFVTPLLQTIVEIATKALPPMLEGFKEIMGHLKTEFGPVLREIIGAFKEVFEALGLNTGEVDVLRITIDALKIGITVAAEVLKGIARVVRDVATAIRAMGDAVRWVVGKWNEMKEAAKGALDIIPPWFRPRSPTPFELGLRGIGSAMKDINFGSIANVSPGMAMAGGGTPVVVNLHYSPVVSLGDRYEAEAQLAPFIAEGLRKAGVTVG